MAEGSELAHVPGNDRTPSCNISSSSRFNNDDASVEVSNVLNILGYGHELRQKRRECYKANDNNIDAPSGFVQGYQTITVGSKAEGLSRCLESDRDVLGVITRVECIEVGFDLNLIPKDKTVFRMDTHICYPGHWILVLERGVPLFNAILLVALRETQNGKVILSSDAVLNNRIMCSQLGLTPIFNERAGPSLPFNVGQCKADTVVALRYHCPSILQRWAARSRHWPPSNVVEKVVSMGAFLTPVGFTGSRNKNIEWRICFNTGETELMINLNDTQLKVYVLLKMIAKDLLKPRACTKK
ncbi:hypothetical protein DPMN_032093 [Dreissena polymorpha]|uniref:Mab-21-like nucleotidyltransferase domain-containing protein n=1 Tax=Dreissena polymorpha TaxID=45954 RepID=A0A9D4M3M3_DREPO|nr:hypothetical protein DPMN_032093 [Dreissena polymorpha]